MDQQVANAADVDLWVGGPSDEVDADRLIRIQAVRVEILQADDFGRQRVLCPRAQPSATRGPLLDRPREVAERAQVVGRRARAEILPERGVFVVLVGEDELRLRRTLVAVEMSIDSGRSVFGTRQDQESLKECPQWVRKSHDREVRRDRDRFVPLLHILDGVSIAEHVALRERQVFRDGLGFQQRLLVRVEDVSLAPGIVTGQRVPQSVMAEQIEGSLLEFGDGRLRLLLSFGPDVAQARFGRKCDRATGRVIDRALQDVVDRGDDGVASAHIDRSHLQRAVVGRFGHGSIRSDDVFLLQRPRGSRRINDRDLAIAILRRVDAIDDRLVWAVIADIDVGVAVSDFQSPVAGAENLARDDDATAAGNDVVNHDGLLLGVEVAHDGNSVGSEVDSRLWLAGVVQERLGVV